MSVISQVYKGVTFHIQGFDNMTDEELNNYIEYIKEETNDEPSSITIIACEDGMIDLSYESKQSFERIRRITGKPEK